MGCLSEEMYSQRIGNVPQGEGHPGYRAFSNFAYNNIVGSELRGTWKLEIKEQRNHTGGISTAK